MPGIKIIPKSDLNLLGAPIYVSAVDKVLEEKMENLTPEKNQMSQSKMLPKTVETETNPDSNCLHCGEPFKKTFGGHFRSRPACKAKYQEMGKPTKLSRSEYDKRYRRCGGYK